MSLWNTIRADEAKGIEEIYRIAYYAIVNQLKEQGKTETQARAYFQQAVVFLAEQVKVNDFDPEMDVTLYLSTVIQGFIKRNKK